MRRSLLFRLLALAGAVAVLSIAATAWLVMASTTAGIRQQQGQALNDDAHIYRTLVRYAARHRDWHGVRRTLRELSADTGRTIVLTTPDRTPLARGGARAPLPRRPAATVDALAVDPLLQADADGDRIIDSVTGPFSERRRAPGGGIPAPVPTESFALDRRQRRALARLLRLTRRCAPDQRVPALLGANGLPVARLDTASRKLARCYRQARRTQLRPYVAPPALLFLDAPGEAAANLDLSGPARRRVLLVALLISGLTLLVTAVAALRLIRPLRALIRASERMTAGDVGARVDARGNDEVGRLGRAFNAMASRREQLEEQRTAMVSDVAHELRTPISNIRGWLEAAQDGVAQPDPAFVDSLLEEATLLSHLVSDLADLSAAEAGELRLHPEPVNVEVLLEQVAVAHQPAADAAGVTLAVDAAGTLVADPVRIRQAVGNLVTNAVRHSPRGGVVTRRADRVANGTAIVVGDEGEGIAPEHLEHVFDRFWRADPSRTRRSGGSGLGLAIVRRLAEAHGGRVAAESELGRGATFTVWLPDGTPAPERSGAGIEPTHRRVTTADEF